MDAEPPWLAGIDGDNARDLIGSDSPLIRVVAGPGAGKTTCLKRRIQRLVEGEGVSPDRIFVGTFTRAIARDLQAELGDNISVSTLHSLAYKLLRDNPPACQGMKLRFMLAYEEACLLYDIAGRVPTLQGQRALRSELMRLQSARAERKAYEDAAFAGAVRDWLQRHGGMLIGEVVYLATIGLESHDIEPAIYDHVMVDEYQDLTAAEQELVELIWSRMGSLVVMGDNNQSIYGFRFNHPAGIDEFRERWSHEGPVDLTLPENRRCSEAVLEMANLMMAEASSSAEPMASASGRTGRVSLVHWPNAHQEVHGLAQHIRARQDESFLVLVPRRFIGYRLKLAVGDDAQTAFHEEVLEHPVAQERFALASALADLDDLVAVRSWLGFKRNTAQFAAERNAKAYASIPPGLGGEELVRGLADGSIRPSGSGSSSLRERAVVLQRLVDGGLAGNLDALGVAFDTACSAGETEPEKRTWLENDLRTLHLAAADAVRTLGEPTLRDVMALLRYRIATRAPLLPDDAEPRVQIMTMHSAKGLEGDNIIVAGAADQLMPGLATAPAQVAEQRRLLYVAVTRAKDKLVVSWPRSVSYAEAIRNGIRVDAGTRTVGGVPTVRLSRTTLLPQAMTGGVDGEAWLMGE